jgi:DNA-binding MarR family transcriptional regulator
MSTTWGSSSPGALAARFARLVEQLGGDTAAAKALGQQRDLLAAVANAQPATLNQVAARVKRGAPAVSRAIDMLVRAGLVDRQPDPNNRRRLALTLTDAGREQLNRPPVADRSLEGRISKLAHSELRALERGIEILERLPR